MLQNHSSRLPKWAGLLILLFSLSTGLWSGSHAQNTQDVRQYVQKARAAYKEKDYAALIENMKMALTLRLVESLFRRIIGQPLGFTRNTIDETFVLANL